MPRFRIAVQTDINERYKGLRDRIRELERGDLKRRMTKEIRRVGEPALAAVQAATLRIDVKSSSGGGRSSTGLRRRVAAATKISPIQSGIRIGVAGSKIDRRYGRSLAFRLNGLGGTWFHPVFGTSEIVEQQGEDAFFTTLEQYAPEFRAGIVRVMDEVTRELDR